MDNDSWIEHKLYITKTLEDLKDGQEELKKIIQGHIIDEETTKARTNTLWAILTMIITPLISFITAKFIAKQ